MMHFYNSVRGDVTQTGMRVFAPADALTPPGRPARRLAPGSRSPEWRLAGDSRGRGQEPLKKERKGTKEYNTSRRTIKFGKKYNTANGI